MKATRCQQRLLFLRFNSIKLSIEVLDKNNVILLKKIFSGMSLAGSKDQFESRNECEVFLATIVS